jgi:HK97 family phage prohead protease
MRNKVLRIASDKLVVKELEDSGNLSIEGYANTTTKDRVGDIILEEAWSKGGLNNYLMNPIVLAFHDHTKPIGQVVDYDISSKGLHVVAEISKAAGDVYNLIREGILKAFSVGFRVEDADYDSDSDIFVIKDLELLELSVVSIPANANTIFSVKKSFENDNEYLEFKNIYSEEEVVLDAPKQEPRKEKKIVDKDTNISLTPEELEAEKQKAIEEAFAKQEAEKAKKAEIESIAVSAGTSGAERLVKELEERLLQQEKSLSDALDGLRGEVTEKNAELEALRNSKMEFSGESTKQRVSDEDVDIAVLAAKSLGKKIEETEFFKSLVTKAGAHLGSVSDADGWEREFSTRLYQDIKDKTIIEPLFSNRIQMNSRTMTFAYNPEAAYASWIADTAYRSTDGSSTGTAVDHEPLDNTLKAEKLASKEYIGYEEEEDAIIQLMPMIREAVVRRVVRSTDTELLRADIGVNSGSGTVASGWGVEGVSTKATDGSAEYTQPGSYGDPITIADLQQTRRQMGVWGLMPSDVVYVVSQAGYYDLLEDPDFRTMDMVGSNATILRGQIAAVNGSPVLVSDSFADDAAGAIQAICLNASNYLFGELRGMTVERDRNIEDQKNILVATRRFAFNEIVPASAGKSSCANLKRPAS